MKVTTIILIITSILLVLFLVLQAFSMNSTNKTESYPYKVVKQYEDFEVRAYAPATFSYVQMASNSYQSTSRKGFSILAGYIFGGNEDNAKIAMTTPVAMELGDSMTVSFMVPSEWDRESLPAPNDQRIAFKEEPAKMVAAIRFGGWANDAKIEDEKRKLSEALSTAGIQHKGNFSYLGYNPPYEVVNRRNEVIVELEDDSSQKNQ